ncbi:MAG: LptF/LptG family permease [Opitutaceae bacterium]|jgi:lipopolysaccharide export system permease protein|nr:LptF/LptG family permease [Opitutaceae bacterium]
MTLIDRHILREWLEILLLVLAATLGLLVMHSLYDELEGLLREEAVVAEIAAYCLVKIPGFLATLLPLCLLVSLLYALGRLHHANEITAMRAAGLGLGRITRAVWVAGVFFCGLVWWLNSSVVPWSVEEARRMRETLQVRRELAGQSPDRVGARTAVTFDNESAGRTWFINRYSQFTRKAYGVTVSEQDASGAETRRLLAREAWRDETGAGWVLRDGRELVFDPASGEVVRTRAFAELKRADFDEDPGLMQVYDAKPEALSLFELRQVIDYHREAGSPKGRAYELRYASVLAESLMPLVIIAFAVPFAVAGVRVNPAVGVSKALGLFVVYFIAMRLGLVLGGRGVLSPTLAALLPHVALIGAGAWAWRRVR